jgi:GT2 family glycosyltransferase
MIWFFTPYSFNKKLFEAYDACMNLIANPDDWVCFTDGDTAFLLPNFGHQVKTYTERYPDTGLFTCYASRCHYQEQIRRGTDTENRDILYHRNQAEAVYLQLNGTVKEMDRRIAGHLMVIQKKTWTLIRPEVARKVAEQQKQILGVDTKISNAILASGLKIRLMRGIYILHYLRLKEGYKHTNHLV